MTNLVTCFTFPISEDTNLTKALISLLFSASFQAKDNIILLREIARDIHSSLGDIDQVGGWFLFSSAGFTFARALGQAEIQGPQY